MPRVRGQTKAQSAFLAEMYELGKSDCGNAFDLSDWPIQEADTAEEVFELGKSALLDYEDDWYEQNEDSVDEAKELGIAKETAFGGWVAGWKECALPRIQTAVDNDRARRKERQDRFYLSDDVDGDTGYFESFDTFQDALDMLARLPQGSIAYGKADGPDFRLVFAMPADFTPPDYLFWVFDDNVQEATKNAAWHVMTTTVLGQPFHRRPNRRIDEMDRRFSDTIAELKRRGYRWEEKDVTKNPAKKRDTKPRKNPGEAKDDESLDMAAGRYFASVHVLVRQPPDRRVVGTDARIAADLQDSLLVIADAYEAGRKFDANVEVLKMQEEHGDHRLWDTIASSGKGWAKQNKTVVHAGMVTEVIWSTPQGLRDADPREHPARWSYMDFTAKGSTPAAQQRDAHKNLLATSRRKPTWKGISNDTPLFWGFIFDADEKRYNADFILGFWLEVAHLTSKLTRFWPDHPRSRINPCGAKR